MKKILLILFLTIASLTVDAQVKFMGIPVDGNKNNIIQKLEKKGFEYLEYDDLLTGDFDGKRVLVKVQTNHNIVWRVVVTFGPFNEWDAVYHYNDLVNKFLNNQNYWYKDQEFPQKIDNDGWKSILNRSCFIEYNHSSYMAVFHQYIKLGETHIRGNNVWFTIFCNKNCDEYVIPLYYENINNAPNGEDL